ncbi:MAG: wax ester/triacylglycerol synthase family O-acyltransferase [Alphaproteobacteria bacterium]|nr:wax ester/triacylglycerol synthase family O-acyltransferase [Deltaproteobacteria bacterium]MCB9690213.1 wax ester/triacylglycerol synthase family O-acyltransferase [Alphaproteobacteria bacterium]
MSIWTSKYQRLTAVDRGFLDMEDDSLHMHVGSVAIFETGDLSTPEGGVDFGRIRDYIASRLHRVPRYRQKITYTPVERHPVWVDDDRFNIDYHLRHTALPRPGDERQLKRLAGRLMSQQLDRGKPLWEIWVVEGLGPDRFAIINKVHHCMIDGISGNEILQQIYTPAPKEHHASPRPFRARDLPSALELFMGATKRRFEAPVAVARTMRDAALAPTRALRRTLETAPAVGRVFDNWSQLASPTPINQPIGPHRRFDWLQMDLDRVRAVKTKMNGTVNDVVLTVVAGAMARFFEDHGIDPGSQEQMRFRVFCPVSLRGERERSTLGNRVAMTIVDLPLGNRPPQERLDGVKESFRSFRESKEALGADVLTSASNWMAPTLVSLSFRMSYRRRAGNMVVTNVPGPQVPLYLLGARMLETYPLVPLFIEQCLGIALFSYAGRLFWGFNSDWETMPDLHALVENVSEAFAELEAHVGSRRVQAVQGPCYGPTPCARTS